MGWKTHYCYHKKATIFFIKKIYLIKAYLCLLSIRSQSKRQYREHTKFATLLKLIC